jgi:4-methyl-5(b-hydroxyethyl)-thiazole monophosphate biosynthesis
MKKIYLLLAEGFEELEAFAPVDLLRRAGADIQTVSITAERVVTGARGIPAVADLLLDDLDYELMDMLILPGGYPGYENLGKSPEVRKLVCAAAQDGKTIAAICGAPSVLGALGLLEGKIATCYPGMEDTLGCIASFEKVVVCDNIITSRGAGTAIDFALALVEKAVSPKAAEQLRKGIVY